MVVLTVKQCYWLVKKRVKGCDVKWICSKLGIHRDTVYYWVGRFHREGWDGLKLKSHRLHNIHQTPQETVDYILNFREVKGWGPCRITGYLRQQKPKGIKPVGHSTVYRILCQAGLNNPLKEPRKTWGKRRFQRTETNRLWQADWKLTRDDEWMITFLDDHSRFIPGSRVHDSATSENTVELFRWCIKEYSVPEQVLTDQGVQFHTHQEDGVTKFDKFAAARAYNTLWPASGGRQR